MKNTLSVILSFFVISLNVYFSTLTAKAETVSTSEYFPLDSGLSWTYLENDLNSVTTSVLSGTYYLNGTATKAIYMAGGEFSGSTAYYSNNDDGISEHKEYTPNMFIENVGFQDVTTNLSPPMKLVNSTAMVGDIVNSYGTATITYSGLGTVSLDYESNTKIVQFEYITVPLGTFKAVKIQNSLTVSGYVNTQYLSITSTSTRWLAKYVGAIKTITNTNGVHRTTDLTGINFLPYLSANFTVDQPTAYTQQTLYFTDMSDGNISSWLWNFGDGNTSTLQNPTHFYINPGSYSVSLTVSGLGNSATETKSNYINISIKDTDNDGLSDYEEENTYLTNPNNSDTDGDGLNDGDEVKIYRTSPVNIDSDSDEIPDGWEVNNGLDPLDYSDAGDDNDGDGVSNILEYKYNTDPMDPNSKPTLGLPWLMLLLE